jgi:hypothetical protein
VSEELIPLSRNEIVDAACNQLVESGVTHGSYLTTEQLRAMAQELGKDDVKFAFFKAEITAFLRGRGLWLTSEGLHGEGYRVGQPVENAYYIQACMQAAGAALDRAIVLGRATDLSTLTEPEARRHQNVLRQAQHQRMMLLRSSEVEKVLKRHRPVLLKPDIEV